MDVREIEVVDMQAALKVLDLVPSKSGMTASDFIRADLTHPNKASFHLTSDLMGVATAPARGRWLPKTPYYIDRRLFQPFVVSVPLNEHKDDNRRKTSPFVWYEKDKKICISWGNRKLELENAPDAAGYGYFTRLEKLKRLQIDKKLVGALLAASSCSTNDPSVPQLNCIYLHKGKVYATDNVSLFTAVHEVLKDAHVPFPVSIVGTMSNELASSVYYGENVVTVLCKNGRVEQLVQVRAKDEFPFSEADERLKWSSRFKPIFSCKSSKFAEITSRLAVYLSGVRREDWVLKAQCEVGNTYVKLICDIAQGRFQETLKLKSSLDSTVVIEWPLDRLVEVFRYLGFLETDVVVKVEHPGNRMHVIEAGDVRLLVAAKVRK